MRGLERGAGCLSLVAAAVHGGVTPEHFSLWWGYGLFFLAATLAQAVFGLLFLTRGTDAARGWPWSRARRPLCAAGILGNLLLVAMWAVSRTVGVPGVGPEAGEVEAVGAVDVLAKLAEAGTVAMLAVLLWRTRPARAPALAPGS